MIERWAVVGKDEHVWSFQKTETAALRIVDGSRTFRIAHMVEDTEAAAMERVRAWMLANAYPAASAVTLADLLTVLCDEVRDRAIDLFGGDGR